MTVDNYYNIYVKNIYNMLLYRFFRYKTSLFGCFFPALLLQYTKFSSRMKGCVGNA